MQLRQRSAPPTYAQQILGFVVVEFQVAVIGIVQGIANVASKMDIRCRDENSGILASILVLDCHDSRQGMLGPFLLGVMLNEVDYFVPVRSKEFSADKYKTGREIIVHTQTGRTRLYSRSFRPYAPLPAPTMENCPALRASRWLGWLVLVPVTIVPALLTELIAPYRVKTRVND